jgi:DNA-binding IclR family transcriptional regulator
MGKALLAFSPSGVVDQVVAHGLERFTPRTLTSADQLRRSLSVVRLTHVAVCRGELDDGYSALAVPVFGGGGAVVAALEAAVRDLGAERRVLEPVLTLAARSLSRELALTPPSARLVLGRGCRTFPPVLVAAAGAAGW